MVMENGSGIITSPTTNLPIYWRGPSLSQGALPAFFYFALSGEESLHLDPFNQPIVFLKDSPIRCFSFTLLLHGQGYDNQTVINRWGPELNKNPHYFDPFFHDCLENIDFLIREGYVDPQKIAVGGISRGGFIATHLAARDPRIQYILGFAPMTTLATIEGLQEIPPGLNLQDLTEQLVDKHVRFYIGNRDLRAKTDACFQFIYQLADAAYHKGHRSPPIEIIVGPSVGFKGHGTLPPVFQDGVDWLKLKLL